MTQLGQSETATRSSEYLTQPKEVSVVEYPVTLMERENIDHRVELVYYGPESRQPVAIHVYWHSGDFPDFAFAVREDQALDAFHHPHWYSAQALAA